MSDAEHRLTGVFNFRDLGGLPVSGGGVTRSGVLFRSDSVHHLTDDDVAVLRERLGLQAVLDLRSAVETINEGRGPLTSMPVSYLNVPLNPAPLDLDIDPASPPGVLTSHVYAQFLDDEAGTLPVAMTVLSALIGRPTVVHCAAGKDRTGLVVALVLDLVGVEREAIVADYLLSAETVDDVNARFRESPRYRRHMEMVAAEFYEVHELSIRLFLERVDAYGGARGWAKERGMDDAEVARFRAALLA